MEVLTKAELSKRLDEIVGKIKNGAIFIYPTDTIYGIGCDARNKKSVAKIRKLKESRGNAPFSIWAPSTEWVEEHCLITKKGEKWMKELPGALTLIMNLQNKQVIADNVNPGLKKIGVRLPDHWFKKVVEKFENPIITTSANRTGEPFMTSIENLNSDVKDAVDFMIYEGEKEARPSKLINVESDKVRER